MKRTITLLLITLVLVTAANAQLSYGVKAGGALTSLPGGGNNYTQPGFFGGITASLPLNNKLHLQAELYYSAQGHKELVTWPDTWSPLTGYTNVMSEEKIPFHLNYINLPLLLRYKPVGGLFIETGFQTGVLVSAKAKSSRGTFDQREYYNALDFSVPVGVGYQLPMGLGITLRYNKGISNVSKESAYTQRNSVLQAGLFYTITP